MSAVVLSHPVFCLMLTLLVFACGQWLFERSGRHPLFNPVAFAILTLIALLVALDIPYSRYFADTQMIHLLLGPATVALAVPLHANLSRVRKALLPMLAALLAGSVTAISVALGVGWLMGLDLPALLSLAPKSATAPVAMGVSERIGGAPALTAVMVLLTGVIGAIAVTPLMTVLRIRDWRARGFAVGVAAHGIGTARAFQVNETAGAFSGIGMGLNAILTAILAPLAASLF